MGRQVKSARWWSLTPSHWNLSNRATWSDAKLRSNVWRHHIFSQFVPLSPQIAVQVSLDGGFRVFTKAVGFQWASSGCSWHLKLNICCSTVGGSRLEHTVAVCWFLCWIFLARSRQRSVSGKQDSQDYELAKPTFVLREMES